MRVGARFVKKKKKEKKIIVPEKETGTL